MIRVNHARIHLMFKLFKPFMSGGHPWAWGAFLAALWELRRPTVSELAVTEAAQLRQEIGHLSTASGLKAGWGLQSDLALRRKLVWIKELQARGPK